VARDLDRIVRCASTGDARAAPLIARERPVRVQADRHPSGTTTGGLRERHRVAQHFQDGVVESGEPRRAG
jgi:hypothetical protein